MRRKQRFSGYPTAFPCKVGNYPCASIRAAGSVYLRSILRHWSWWQLSDEAKRQPSSSTCIDPKYWSGWPCLFAFFPALVWMKTKHLNIEMGFAPSCPLITLNATFAMMRGTYIQTHFQNLIYPSDQSSPGTLDPPLPTHERYQNSNANFGFRGSCQMRQNGCHPHHYTSAIGIAPVG